MGFNIRALQSKRFLLTIVGLSCLAVPVIGYLIINARTYPAGEVALAALVSSADYTVIQTTGEISFQPSSSTQQGVVFYPGGLVRPEAYSPICKSVAQAGVLCSIAKMPLNLAVLNINAADGIMTAHSEVTEWVIVGHSLGGSMAVRFAQSQPSKISGLVMLAAYADVDISNADYPVTVLVGSQDMILNRGNFDTNKALLPANAKVVTIQGGNHSGFGDYGPQTGDGERKIAVEAQWEQTVAEIVELFEL